jgi:hypothetical protein
VSPGTSTDFLATSTNVNIEYPGDFCYTNDNGASCVPIAFSVPALSPWGICALAGMLLLFGAWMLKTKQTT